MSLIDALYLDTPASTAAVQAALTGEMGFEAAHKRSADHIPWLLSGRGIVKVRSVIDGDSGPCEYRQLATIEVLLAYNKEDGAFEHLLRVAGDLLQRFPGDAVLESEAAGMAILLRRGETVWVRPDPFILRHLFSGSFRPVKLVHGLPPVPENVAG